MEHVEVLDDVLVPIRRRDVQRRLSFTLESKKSSFGKALL